MNLVCFMLTTPQNTTCRWLNYYVCIQVILVMSVDVISNYKLSFNTHNRKTRSFQGVSPRCFHHETTTTRSSRHVFRRCCRAARKLPSRDQPGIGPGPNSHNRRCKEGKEGPASRGGTPGIQVIFR